MRRIFLFGLLFMGGLIQTVKAQFADPWYNWYYSQQQMLNMQMWNMMQQQHQITELYRDQAVQKSRELQNSPTQQVSPNVPRFSNENRTQQTSSDRVCGTCKGDGKCISCHGSGYRTDNLFGTGIDTSKRCGVCGGNGRCNSCGGRGRR